MKGTISGKILESHLVEGSLEKGKEIGIRIDQTLTQDATGTLVYLEFMALGIDQVRTELSVSYVDHNMLQTGPENADDHIFLKDCASRFGVYFSRPGNGICHQIHLERFAVPGKTLLGSDSHTPTSGGIGMLAIGAGGLDVVLAMSGAPFYMTVPSVVSIQLKGRMPEWVSAKDIILYLLKRLTVKGGLGKIIEYGGEGIKELTVPERATITNMGAELGAWTSIFPSDEMTKRFMKAQKREKDWIELFPEKDAEYDDVIEVDLSLLEPYIACPFSPDNVRPVSELSGKKVDQVVIGSCTNSSYKDLRLVAELLKGKKVHPDVSLVISAGSRQVLQMLLKEGALSYLIDAGARILELSCGPCIGMGQAPPSGGVSLRTFNRNFKGRCGTPDAEVYLCSPQVAAAAAIEGRIVHPEDVFGKEPKIELPDEFHIDDSMIIPPSKEKIEIRMGPNIKPIPELEPIPESLRLEIILKLGDNITTDDILPGGAKVLPLRSNIEKISQFTFHQIRPDFHKIAKEKGSVAIVGGENYGQGSSREHAALAPRYLGVRMVLAKSFARLHRANLINFGIVPVVIDEDAYNMLNEGMEIYIDGIRDAISNSEIIRIRTKEKEIEGRLILSDREKEILLFGGSIGYYREKLREKEDGRRGN